MSANKAPESAENKGKTKILKVYKIAFVFLVRLCYHNFLNGFFADMQRIKKRN